MPEGTRGDAVKESEIKFAVPVEGDITGSAAAEAGNTVVTEVAIAGRTPSSLLQPAR